MPRARKHLICLSETPYYHVTARCVRRAFLCGVDVFSGQSYEHRRSWIEDRIRVLSSLFSVQLCAYAVMSNHYHLVVKLSPQESDTWDDAEVLRRWTALFKGPLLVQRRLDGEALSGVERETLGSVTRVYRQRLGSLSWFMKCLNEPIARRANAEDGCTGHFWEARFHSQPLRSERALLAAMAYVDLNPIRAGIAPTLEDSEYTSIKARIEHAAGKATSDLSGTRMIGRGELNHCDTPLRPLMAFTEATTQSRDLTTDVLPLRESDYLKLVDETGRTAVRGKQGKLDPALVPILMRLGLSSEDWMQCASAFKTNYRNGELRLKRSA